jgi:hypothetical protein
VRHQELLRAAQQSDGIDVNARCLDEGSVQALVVEAFDGRNWEANAAALAHLSR